jgi:hypothetical protein
MLMDSYYFGMITNVYSPTDKENASKYQYEYQVLVIGDDYASIPVRCIRKDEFGSADDFDDVVLEVATKVMVKFPRGDRSLGIITEATRNYPAPMNPVLGKHWRRRFNKVVQIIDKDGNYSVTSDSGPNLQIKPDKIIIDDSKGQKVTFDKASQTLTIECKTLNINVTGDATVNVSGKLNASVGGDMTAKIGGKAKIEAGGDCDVKAGNITLNGKAGKVLTTLTDPVVDSIFGVPTQGVETVKAGG